MTLRPRYVAGTDLLGDLLGVCCLCFFGFRRVFSWVCVLCGRVIKRNPSSKRQVKFIERESSILKAVDHEHIVKTLDIFDRPDSLVIVTEFLEGGELFSRIIDEKCFTEQKARDIMRQILLGVQYLHSLGIVHRYVVVPRQLAARPFAPDWG